MCIIDGLLLKETEVIFAMLVLVLLVQFIVEFSDRLRRFEVRAGQRETLQIEIVDRHEIQDAIGFVEKVPEGHQLVPVGLQQALEKQFETLLEIGRQTA